MSNESLYPKYQFHLWIYIRCLFYVPAYPHLLYISITWDQWINWKESTISLRMKQKIFKTCVSGPFQIDPRIMGLSLRVPDIYYMMDAGTFAALRYSEISAKAITCLKLPSRCPSLLFTFTKLQENNVWTKRKHSWCPGRDWNTAIFCVELVFKIFITI